VVSVYLNTRWTDEHQRERTRVCLKTELRRAHEARPPQGLADALNWIETEGEALISQASRVDTHGVALFACPALGLREVISLSGSPGKLAFVRSAPVSAPRSGPNSSDSSTRVRQGGAVHGNEHFGGPCTLGVNRPADQLLPGPRFSQAALRTSSNTAITEALLPTTDRTLHAERRAPAAGGSLR
jgi:hypothetical protein